MAVLAQVNRPSRICLLVSMMSTVDRSVLMGTMCVITS
ncbi:Uncharacterised protein [Vibrio cholerae]|nr:Uncharacterised protein [Vibrio cholerae]